MPTREEHVSTRQPARSRRSVSGFAAAIAGGTLYLAVIACSGAPPSTSALDLAPGETRLILVSLDGFRWDFAARADTPHLDGLARRGVRAEKLLAAYPTKTFPNHYTLVTGLWPANHGIVSNNIYDPEMDERFSLGNREAVRDARWWHGEPIWVTAEKQGLKTAPNFWPGSEAAIDGVRPTYWDRFQHDLPNEARVDRLFEWLDLPAAERPRFLTLYSSTVDSAAHRYNPDNAPEVDRAIARVDAMLGRLLRGLEERGMTDSTHVLVVSDHGMAATSAQRVIALDDYVDLGAVDIVDMGALLSLWPAPEDVDAVYSALTGAHPRLSVYRRNEVPERLRYRGHRRIPPILGIPDEGWSVSFRARLEDSPERFEGGAHGYDPDLESMGALFVAAGPGLRQGAVVPPFRNIHLYELMCHLLDLDPAENDGDLEAIRSVLREPA